MKELFIQVMKRAKTKYNFRCKSFCIMGNHVHLIIQTIDDESISDIMRWILSVFAVKFNKIFKFKGHVWYDRFKSKIIFTYNQFLNTMIYIANNPVRARLTKSPFEYDYSSIKFHQNGDYSLLEPPDEEFELIYLYVTLNFNYTSARKANSDIGFYPAKPGRHACNID